jgi:hypothetical protein
MFKYGDLWWNDTERGKLKKFGENPVTVSLCPPKIPRKLIRARTRGSAVKEQQLSS